MIQTGSTKPSDSFILLFWETDILHQTLGFQLPTFPITTIQNPPNQRQCSFLCTPFPVNLISSMSLKLRKTKFHKQLSSHTNPHVRNLSSLTLPSNPPRLKRHWPRYPLNNCERNIISLISYLFPFFKNIFLIHFVL